MAHFMLYNTHKTNHNKTDIQTKPAYMFECVSKYVVRLKSINPITDCCSILWRASSSRYLTNARLAARANKTFYI